MLKNLDFDIDYNVLSIIIETNGQLDIQTDLAGSTRLLMIDQEYRHFGFGFGDACFCLSHAFAHIHPFAMGAGYKN